MLYCAFVRSILEYGVVVWDPYTAYDRNQIERVQRKFLNYAAFTLNIDHIPHDYIPVMDRLGLSTLVDRRQATSLNFLRQLIDGKIDSPELLSFINLKVPSTYIRHTYPFLIPKFNTNYLENQPIVRMMRMKNNDPSFLN
ncbi:uncharacterized protein LOC103310213 [Acyrthosiphon pisum]|uniref:Uncharacterized protein n=1 Tax=Acyrthosiphon pisum TaxID=7029 RepID=A0A8R2FAM8_ACYPI|nr:uncharacterized protein LOC103310213 [Acyrthosiphon pisum]|eukprot:XP_008185952.1 PREDICTED: uncharacterized protein LOC103310213 [Acyrthosiphon pisum]